jgi:AraC family transcriptional regulator
VRVEEWHSGPQELPESVLFQHGLVINESVVPAEVHWSGRRPDRSESSRGNVGLLPAGMPYSARGFVPSTTLVMALAPEVLSAIARPAGFSGVELMPAYGVDDPFIHASMKALAADVRAGYPLGALYGDSIVAALAMHLIRHHAADPRVAVDTPGAADWRRRRLLEYIHDRLHEPLTLHELAAVAGLDVFSFARWFKKALRVPPYASCCRRGLNERKHSSWHRMPASPTSRCSQASRTRAT